jgi:hypothetical protein
MAMKIFVKTGVASNSINFVDEDNRVLGWCAEQICCEDHSCCIHSAVDAETKEEVVVTDTDDMSDEEYELHTSGKEVRRVFSRIKAGSVVVNLGWLNGSTIDLPNYRIDPEYFKRAGCTAVFRLTNIHCKHTQLFVVLENLHNGYYAHGFSLEVGGVTKIGGQL